LIWKEIYASIAPPPLAKDDELLDDITLSGPQSTSISTDDKGNQGQIVIDTGTPDEALKQGIDSSTNTIDIAEQSRSVFDTARRHH